MWVFRYCNRNSLNFVFDLKYEANKPQLFPDGFTAASCQLGYRTWSNFTTCDADLLFQLSKAADVQICNTRYVTAALLSGPYQVTPPVPKGQVRGEGFLSAVCTAGLSANGFKLKHGRFRLDTRKKPLIMRRARSWELWMPPAWQRSETRLWTGRQGPGCSGLGTFLAALRRHPDPARP